MKLSPTVRASYELLGLAPESAGAQDLKKAYHRLALLYHPDRNPHESAAREFQKVTEAYELLSNPSQVAELNRRHLREKLLRPVVEGIEITFGSFFGYRTFDLARAAGRASGDAKKLTGKSDGAARESDSWIPIEENNSVLDNAAYDAVEVVYAGRFSLEDEERVRGDIKGAQLPWVVLNNQGLLRFFERDLKGARKCYAELCERIPGNILFSYRLGLCMILEGFKKPRRTLLGALKPDRIQIDKGVELLRYCIKLGEDRTVGRQKCLVIRKVLADVLERTGRVRQAKALWREVLYEEPGSVEAIFRLKGATPAAEALKIAKRGNIVDSLSDERKRLGPARRP